MNMVTLPPGTISTRSGRHVDAEALVEVGRDGLAQRQDAGGRRVAVVPVAQRLDGGLDDVLGRAEIGLADAEIDDVACPGAASSVARARTAKAFSSPIRSKATIRCAAWRSPPGTAGTFAVRGLACVQINARLYRTIDFAALLG